MDRGSSRLSQVHLHNSTTRLRQRHLVVRLLQGAIQNCPHYNEQRAFRYKRNARCSFIVLRYIRTCNREKRILYLFLRLPQRQHVLRYARLYLFNKQAAQCFANKVLAGYHHNLACWHRDGKGAHKAFVGFV